MLKDVDEIVDAAIASLDQGEQVTLPLAEGLHLAWAEPSEKTARIEKDVGGQTTTIRLIGQVQAEHLDALREQIQSSGPRPLLDLDEVTLVDVQVVHFLGACENEGTELLHCPPYVREWILREGRP